MTRSPKASPLAHTAAPWVVLVALCLVASFLGLTSHGVTSWHEGQRLVVAREMHAAGEWIVPTINGRPYLAKPPLMYWCQIALARLTGGEPALLHLRLTVALAGLAAVLGLYALAPALYRRLGGPAAHARQAAFWAAATLATGILVVRSTRVAEIDILLLPVAVFGVGGIMNAWISHRERQRTAWGWIALAVFAGIAAALAKSVPGLIVLAVGGYGAIALFAAFAAEPLDTRPALPGFPQRPLRPPPCALTRLHLAVGALFGLAAGAAVIAFNPFNLTTLLSALILAAFAAPLGLTLARFECRIRLAALFAAYSRTHPILVLGAPLLALWGWQRLASARVGAQAATDQLTQELDANFSPFPAQNPVKMLEAASYGVGLASWIAIAIAILTLRAWVRQRRTGAADPRPGGLSPLSALCMAWTLGGLLVFSAAGNGHGRYLTPFWPGFALLAGWGIAVHLSRRSPRAARATRAALISAIALLALGQGFWYGWGRERYFAFRSPRALGGELASRADIDPARVCALGFYRVALDYYLGHTVQPVGDVGRREALIGVRAWTLEELRARVAEGGGWTILITADEDGAAAETPESRLASAGLAFRELDLGARFNVGRNNASRVRALHLELAP